MPFSSSTGILQEEQALDNRIKYYRSIAYAQSTKKTYRSQRDCFLRFCSHFNYSPVPASTQTISRYAVFLGRTLTYASISNYLNVIRIMHLESGLANPLLDNWYLHTVMRGLKHDRNRPPRQKLPITLSILQSISAHIDLSSLFFKAFWAACLCAFFTFFRKSSLVPSSSNHDCATELCHSDVTFYESEAIITAKHSKTIQCRERLLRVPIPRIPNSDLCPVTALQTFLNATPEVPASAPLFAYPASSSFAFLTHASFAKT